LAVEITTVTTYSCDAYNCISALTLGGEHPDCVAEENGWNLSTIPGKEFCPDCTAKLDNFLNGIKYDDGKA
jgi:hypothetical protein